MKSIAFANKKTHHKRTIKSQNSACDALTTESNLHDLVPNRVWIHRRIELLLKNTGVFEILGFLYYFKIRLMMLQD